MAAGQIDVRNQSCAIDGAGVLFCRGSEFSGELGNGGALNEEQPAPTPVDTTGAIYPVVGGWDGDGTDTVGVKAGTTLSLNTPTTPPPPTSP